MPIIKRSNLTLLPVEPKPTRDTSFRVPGRPLSDILAEVSRKASDAAWAGDVATADKLEQEANSIRKRLADGELYEIDF